MNSQRGSVLIVSLVFLLILTLVGISAMNMSSLEERMAGNFKDHQMAFQIAEAALVEAEGQVENEGYKMTDFFDDCSVTSDTCFDSTCAKGLCSSGKFPSSADAVSSCELGDAKPWQNWANWNDTNKFKEQAALVPGAAAKAKYMVEFRCFIVKDPASESPDPKNFVEWSPHFRITVLAKGGTEDSQVMLQSTYKLTNF